MAAQGERVSVVVGMDESNLESMVQDGDPEQDIVVEEHELPQTDLEPEMGAAAAAVCDTSPPPLHQNPPIPAESAQLSVSDMAQVCAMFAGVTAAMQQMKEEIKKTE